MRMSSPKLACLINCEKAALGLLSADLLHLIEILVAARGILATDAPPSVAKGLQMLGLADVGLKILEVSLLPPGLDA